MFLNGSTNCFFVVRHQNQTAIIFSPAIVMDSMRTQVLFLIFALLVLAVLGSGCMNLVPGDVTYKSGSITFTIRSEEAVPDGVLEVAVFRLQDFKQVELSRNADNFPLKAGDNVVTIPLAPEKGNYRCFIYVTQRQPAIRW